MVPSVALPPVIPFTSHAILAPAATQKDAVNDCVCPRATLAALGAIEFAAAHVTVALAFPDLALSAALVAVIVTTAGDGGAGGAVYNAVAVFPDVPVD